MPTVEMVRTADTDGGETKARFIRRLFDTIAWRYDLFNRCVTLSLDRRWRRTALTHAQLSSGMRVLDLCTGTGELALEMVSPIGGRGAVVGLDFSASMLRYAAQKAERRGRRVEWLLGDGQQLPFGPGSFDRVTIGFSTRNFAHLDAALSEMARVLRPYGRLVVLETGKPQHPLVKLVYYTYLFGVMPFVGLLVCGLLWPFRYLARSIRRFDQPPQFMARLRRAGFERVAHAPLSWGLADLYVGVKGIA